MAPKKTAEEYKDLYFEEKFDAIGDKLDDIKDIVMSKASSSFVQRVEDRVRMLEQTHIPCASVVLVQREVHEMQDKFALKEEFEQLKRDFEPIKNATDGAVYFSRHPKQLRMLVIGAIILFIASIFPTWMTWRKFAQETKNMRLIEVPIIPPKEQH